MSSTTVVVCSKCKTQLELPPRATSIPCSNCRTVTPLPALAPSASNKHRPSLSSSSSSSMGRLIAASVANNLRPSRSPSSNSHLIPSQSSSSSSRVASLIASSAANSQRSSSRSPSSNSHLIPSLSPPPPAPYPSYSCGYPPAASLRPLLGQGQKKAVICGINYMDSPGVDELRSCINDANRMKELLMTQYGYHRSDILVLTDEHADHRKPTKRNIQMAMTWLVAGCQDGDTLVFHFSGHGGQYIELNGTVHETLLPLDYLEPGVGMIIDDEINDTIVQPLVSGVKLHAIIDACYSGTALNLPFLCRMQWNGTYAWEDHSPRNGKGTGTKGGKAFFFSGCDDYQTSADTSPLSRVLPLGNMTYSFVLAIEQGQAATYGSVLSAMRASIRKGDSSSRAAIQRTGSSSGRHRNARLAITGGRSGELGQEPQLSTSEIFDVYAEPFFSL